jgi:hypothetical protein
LRKSLINWAALAGSMPRRAKAVMISSSGRLSSLNRVASSISDRNMSCVMLGANSYTGKPMPIQASIFWIPRHRFEAREGGTLVADHVRYAMPGGSRIDWLFERRNVERIFLFRRWKLLALIGRRSKPKRATAPSRARPHLE